MNAEQPPKYFLITDNEIGLLAYENNMAKVRVAINTICSRKLSRITTAMDVIDFVIQDLSERPCTREAIERMEKENGGAGSLRNELIYSAYSSGYLEM